MRSDFLVPQKTMGHGFTRGTYGLREGVNWFGHLNTIIKM